MNISNAIRYRLLGGLIIVLLISIIGIFVFDKEGVETHKKTQRASLSFNPDFDANSLITPQTKKRLEQARQNEQTQDQTSQEPPQNQQQQAPTQQQTTTQDLRQQQPVQRQAAQKRKPDSTRQTPAATNRLTGWLLRVATFSQQQNALNLQQKLKRDLPNVASFIKEIKGQNGVLYVLTLGPWQKKKDAERIQTLMRIQHNMKTLITQVQ